MGLVENKTDSKRSTLFTDFPEAEGAPEATPEEIQQEAEKWVQRCQYSAPAAVSLWIGWIIASQLLRDQLPAGWFMASFDDSSVTGW
jgi:hypothetical protein